MRKRIVKTPADRVCRTTPVIRTAYVIGTKKSVILNV